MEFIKNENITRIIEESVPGKQITLSHVIASPIQEVYESVGVESLGAMGILAITPYETAIIAADIAAKASNVEIGYIDRMTGYVLLVGDVESVETALAEVNSILKNVLNFTTPPITRT